MEHRPEWVPGQMVNMGTLLSQEPLIRLGISWGLFLTFALTEFLFPKRPVTISRWKRWPSNIAITLINAFMVRLILPLSAVGFAALISEKKLGIFNFTNLSLWLEVLLSVVLLDLAIYAQHVIFHRIPNLWRLHRMHHTDLAFDVSTGSRFHPIEIALSMGIKLIVITFLGAPALGVLIFEILLNATALFNHSNLNLPAAIDAFLRSFLVTPDMHRTHHSIVVRETNSNFGFNLPWWDRLFGTYRKDPDAGHLSMVIGIAHFRSPRELVLDRLLTQPFRKEFP